MRLTSDLLCFFTSSGSNKLVELAGSPGYWSDVESSPFGLCLGEFRPNFAQCLRWIEFLRWATLHGCLSNPEMGDVYFTEERKQ